MIRINVEIEGEAGPTLVAARARSIEQALAMVEGRYAGERYKLLFPIPPESFFVKEPDLAPGFEDVPHAEAPDTNGGGFEPLRRS